MAQPITIRPLGIPVETCSSSTSWTSFTGKAIVEHTTQPVYFYDTVKRIATRLPSAVWLEVGSASRIIDMAHHILTQSGKPHILAN
ncbi:hypothetical protein EYZ11_001051 [Aspergillus tanneri]|nr:hypothetical protein EYZ11_001051 [Aspergillus tanneri]